MTTQLTNTGWVDNNGIALGAWSAAADNVNATDEIRVAIGANVNTLGGNDVIENNGGKLGIFNSDTINTAGGSDTITGIADDIGIFNSDTILTAGGVDTIRGEGDFIGIFNSNTINTDGGSDNITGIADIGIFNSGTIVTGNGTDTVDALTGGFAGGGTVNLGQGNDIIRGFGQQTVNGAQGNSDTAELGFTLNNQVTFGANGTNGIDVIFDGQTMSFTNVETFDFNGNIFTLQQLQAQI